MAVTPARRVPDRGHRTGLQAELDLELARLQDRLDRGQVTGRVGAVHQTVVVGEGQVGHVADGDDRALLRLQDGRALDRGADAEDRDLARRHDDRVEEGTARTGVGDGEGRAGQLVGRDLV